MKKLSLIVVLLVFVSSALADTFDLESTHTYVYFKIDHLERGNLTGVFKDVTGVVKIDGEDSKKPSVDVTVKVDSIDTFNKKRDEHLLGPDFFNAKRFKTFKFISTNIKKISAKNYEITGDLTVKGKTKKVTAKMVRGKTGNDPWGAYRAGGNVTFEFDRRDFGVGKKDFDAPVIGNTVYIDFYWEAVRK